MIITSRHDQAAFEALLGDGSDLGMEMLLSDEHFSVDGTLIEAWASLKSFRPKGGVEPDDSDNSGSPGAGQGVEPAGADWRDVQCWWRAGTAEPERDRGNLRAIDAAFSADPALAKHFPDAPAAKGGASADLKTYFTDRQGHNRRYAMDEIKIRSELGYAPKGDFAEGSRRRSTGTPSAMTGGGH